MTKPILSKTIPARSSSLETFDKQSIQKDLITVLTRETEALSILTKQLPEQAVTLVETILQTTGRVVFCGMGKSGHVGRKLVATFSSMGTPAMFLHPSEALHGDLGMVQKNDLFIALSKSGTGPEIKQIFEILKMQGNKTVLICCRKGALTSWADLVIPLPFEREACDLNLAPTSSSTLMIAFGDAVAVAVSKQIGFQTQDFARAHPAGALGKRLLSTVQSYMYQKDELPLISKTTAFQDVLVAITTKKLGVAIVVDTDMILCGIITDGDLRRACELGPTLFEKNAADIMTANPKSIDFSEKAYRALEIMEQFNITSLVVTQNSKVIGLVHIHDLVKAGIKT